MKIPVTLTDFDRELNLKFEENYAEIFPDDVYSADLARFQRATQYKYFYQIIKRLLDLVIALCALVILLIPFFVLSMAIFCETKGNPFFLNRRVGRNGKIFYCVKFRTMKLDAPPEEATSRFSDADAYITPLGKFLRKTSIDELPQLFNVLLGQMSLVGYRPLVPSEANCNELRESLGVFRCKPGITGYAQVIGRDDVYYKNKAFLDAIYAKYANIPFDICLLIATIKVVVGQKANKDAN